MKNKYLYILLGLGAGVGAFYLVRSKVQPSFSVESLDRVSKSGEFSFGGSKNTFSLNSAGSASGRNGYVVQYGMKDGLYTFELYKKGSFVKTLDSFTV